MWMRMWPYCYEFVFIQKFDIEMIINRLEINGDMDGMKNSFFAFSDPNPKPINPDMNIIGHIIFNWYEDNQNYRANSCNQIKNCYVLLR